MTFFNVNSFSLFLLKFTTIKSNTFMHKIDIDFVEMTLDIMKYSINRITNTSPELGSPKKSSELKELVGETVTPNGIGGETAFAIWKDILSKANVPVSHPRNLSFVPSAPSRASILFDLVTSASNIHGSYWMMGAGGIFAENQAMEWLVSLTGLPEGAFGVFTSGGSSANLSSIVTAREYWRSKNPENEKKRGMIIISGGAHSSVITMAKITDTDVHVINKEERLTGADVREELANMPEEERNRVFAVIATAGTTNAGIIDDLEGIAQLCEEQKLWFHVDAAYGGGALASPKVRHLFNGIEKADSITIDPHKWLFTTYDCGAVIYKKPELASQALSQHGSYLDIFQDEGAKGFNPSDYQVQLTRKLRGLSLWFSLAMHGTEVYRKAVETGLDLAQKAKELITQNPNLEMVREPGLSCVLFRRKNWVPQDYYNWTYRNHKGNIALVTPTKWKNDHEMETVARFCFINPDTTEEDLKIILETMN